MYECRINVVCEWRINRICLVYIEEPFQALQECNTDCNIATKRSKRSPFDVYIRSYCKYLSKNVNKIYHTVNYLKVMQISPNLRGLVTLETYIWFLASGE
jgi:hypothetical protein